MSRFRIVKLQTNEKTELEQLETAVQDAIASHDTTQRREAMRREQEFLRKAANARGLDPTKCTIASDGRGVRLRYEQ
jgi:hypothetical protein